METTVDRRRSARNHPCGVCPASTAQAQTMRPDSARGASGARAGDER